MGDRSRNSSASLDVQVEAGLGLERPVRLVRGAVVRGATSTDGEPARVARVRAVHESGYAVELTANGRGEFVAAGLPGGSWALTAVDRRRGRTVAAVHVRLTAGSETEGALDLRVPTVDLLVHLLSSGRPDLRAVTAVHRETGRRHEAEVVAGLAGLRGLAPGGYDLVVPASDRHLGATHDLGHVGAPALTSVEVTLRPAARLVGRVVDIGTLDGQYAAVLTLLDADGHELERTRADRSGHFALGHGLDTRAALTIVATTGPEHLHVTRVAVADVATEAGVCAEVGWIALPAVTSRESWAPRAHAIRTMRLPATR